MISGTHPNNITLDKDTRKQLSDSDSLWAENTAPNTVFTRAIESIKNITSLTSALRIAGALAVLASMSLFLLQGWSEQSDFARFCIMLAQTTLLSLAGFAMVKCLQETKGARLFFGLSLTSVTANFATLGALIYSVFSLDQLTGDYSNFALWQASSATTALASLGIAMVILVPVVWLCFSVLIKPMAKPLALSYLGINLLLLIPVRDAIIIMPIVTGLLVWLGSHRLFGQHKTTLENTASIKTKEGGFARLILLFPLVVMALRSWLHYPIDELGSFIISASLYVLLSVSINQVGTSYTKIAATAAFLTGLMTSTLLAFEVTSLGLPLFALAIAGMSIDLYQRKLSEHARALLTGISCFLITTSLIAEYWFNPSLANVIFAATAGAVMMALGLYSKVRALLWSGMVLLLAIPLSSLDDISSVLINSGWLGLAIAGVVIIVAASVLERYGAIIRLKFFSKEDEQPLS